VVCEVIDPPSAALRPSRRRRRPRSFRLRIAAATPLAPLLTGLALRSIFGESESRARAVALHVGALQGGGASCPK